MGPRVDFFCVLCSEVPEHPEFSSILFAFCAHAGVFGELIEGKTCMNYLNHGLCVLPSVAQS